MAQRRLEIMARTPIQGAAKSNSLYCFVNLNNTSGELLYCHILYSYTSDRRSAQETRTSPRPYRQYYELYTSVIGHKAEYGSVGHDLT